MDKYLRLGGLPGLGFRPRLGVSFDSFCDKLNLINYFIRIIFNFYLII